MEYTYARNWKTQVSCGGERLMAAEIAARLNRQQVIIEKQERLLKQQTTMLEKAEKTMRFLENQLLEKVRQPATGIPTIQTPADPVPAVD